VPRHFAEIAVGRPLKSLSLLFKRSGPPYSRSHAALTRPQVALFLPFELVSPRRQRLALFQHRPSSLVSARLRSYLDLGVCTRRSLIDVRIEPNFRFLSSSRGGGQPTTPLPSAPFPSPSAKNLFDRQDCPFHPIDFGPLSPITVPSAPLVIFPAFPPPPTSYNLILLG